MGLGALKPIGAVVIYMVRGEAIEREKRRGQSQTDREDNESGECGEGESCGESRMHRDMFSDSLGGLSKLQVGESPRTVESTLPCRIFSEYIFPRYMVI